MGLMLYCESYHSQAICIFYYVNDEIQLRCTKKTFMYPRVTRAKLYLPTSNI